MRALSQSVEESGLDPVQCGFDSLAHYFGSLAQSVEASGSNPVQSEFESQESHEVLVAQWKECYPAKVEVEGSNPSKHMKSR